MKKFVIQTILLLLVIGGGIYFYSNNSAAPNLPFVPQSNSFKQLQINGNNFKVEIADTPEKRNKGLGGRSGLGANEGMLFIFPQRGKYPFWMKGMHFPLDFVWISGDKVVETILNVQPPAPNQTDANIPIFEPAVDIDKVLEVSAGTVQRLNLKVGDTISLQ